MFRGRSTFGAALTVLLLAWVFGRAPRVAGRPQSLPPALPAGTASGAFGSAAGCAALVGGSQRLPRAAGLARFASWNLHWFPDGQAGQSANGAGADLAWVSCALWWLDADVIAVQEVKQSPEAQAALATLLSELNRLSGARYVAQFDDCGSRVPQHVGLIWNAARVTTSDVETLAALNPHGSACENQLRPGLAARVRLPGGLDLGVVSAHFKSMSDQHGFDLRSRSFAAVPGVLRDATKKTHDADFLLLGDLNTMGCSECSPAVSPQDELAEVGKRLADAGLRLVPADAAGSELSGGRMTLLDHAVASATMQELGAGVRTHIVGACAGGGKAPSERQAKQLRRSLSDHCPFVLDLADRDLD